MITGFAKKICLYCGNHETNDIEMYIKQTETDAFYACPKYYSDNRDGNEKPCLNHISINEYEKMLNILMDTIEQEDDPDDVYLKNMRFQTPTAHYHVFDETPNQTKISVLSKLLDRNEKPLLHD